MKLNYLDFQKEINQRGIDCLIHFTPCINLLSIFEQGRILSRSLLEKFEIDQTDIFDYVEFTDDIRFDDKSYINLTIQHPNSFLFSRFRDKTKDNCYIKWCVLKIDKKYIYKNDTLFSVTNAANSYNMRVTKITGDIDKFKIMFAPAITVVTSYGVKKIERDNLKNKYPTDEQAEVLVKGEIPVSDILQICFENENDLASVKAALSEYDTNNFVVDTTLFSNNRL